MWERRNGWISWVFWETLKWIFADRNLMLIFQLCFTLPTSDEMIPDQKLTLYLPPFSLDYQIVCQNNSLLFISLKDWICERKNEHSFKRQSPKEHLRWIFPIKKLYALLRPLKYFAFNFEAKKFVANNINHEYFQLR
jgi:hypothetical protein